MTAMPRPRPPHLHCETTRHGRTVWYVRLGKGPRIRLRAAWGSPEFEAEYRAAVAGEAASGPRRAKAGTFEWAEALYRKSSAWAALSPATQRQRANILKRIVASAGDIPLAHFTRAKIIEGRERRAATPAAARHFVETMRTFFAWAIENDLARADPTKDVRTPRKSGGGFAAWDEAEIAAFRARWPLGTRERVAFDTLILTGLRRGDAVMLGRQHVRDGVARLTTEKTGERVTLPITAELAASWAAGPCGDLTYICGERGAPLTKESFGNWFRDACRAAGVSKSAHGLRKAAATRAANAGFSEAQLEARFGWRGGRMASLYTRSMDRERLSLEAQEKLETRTSIPAPAGKVRAQKQKKK